LVVGASGATGRLLVRQLLARGERVRVVVRSAERFRGVVGENARLEVTEAGVLDLDDAVLGELVRGCGAVASCLGHNLSLRGLFGPPWRLVAGAMRRLTAAVEAQDSEAGLRQRVRLVLMGSTGVRNRDLEERVSLAQRAVVGALRALVPPHADNEAAADFLRTRIGPGHPRIGWVVVRPDGLVDAEAVSDYDAHPSPTRSAIFNAGKTSRINVAHFMAELMRDDALFERWGGRMPVVYNRG